MDFKDLFEQVKQFKKRQEQQKYRGLNNYNILTTVLKEHDEVRLHSRMIASFLDPFGEHYQSTLFLDKFLEVLHETDLNINSKNSSVYREYKNIDLYITDGNKHIIIENKVYAKDKKNQIERYVQIIKDENQDLKPNDILVVYLSLDRDEPTKYSLGNLSIDKNIVKKNSEKIALFKSIHYKDDILTWLEKCQYEVQNITNLNEVFRQYIDVVKMITNQYKEKIMSLSDYILKNKEVYKLAMEIKDELPTARENSINNFFNKMSSLLEKELGDKWTIELVGNLKKQHNGNFHICKKNWNKDRSLIFAFEFDDNNYTNGYFGITRLNSNIDIEKIINKFNSRLKKLNNKTDTKWWLHWEWLHNIEGFDDFIEYIQFHENAEEDFIKRVMRLIKTFELDSNLITDINNYLNNKDNN